MRGKKKKLLIVLSLVVVFTLCFFLFDMHYIIGQGIRLFSIRKTIRDINFSLLTDAGLDPVSRDFLLSVREIREFAITELGLKDTANYTKYVETDRTYLVDVVSAVRADSFKRYQRWYPIVGEVFYKGFFDKRGADRFAGRLKKRGYDVYVRQVGAYSSLGRMVDPLYTYMRAYPEYRLAEMIIHEQVHATVWIPGHNQFNEELATFIGREGAAEYIRRKYGIDSPVYNYLLAVRADRETFLSELLSVYTELQKSYTITPDRERRLEVKQEILSRARHDFIETYHAKFLTDMYLYFADKEWDHALLDVYLQYTEDLSLYYQLYEFCNNNLPDLLRMVISFGEGQADPKQALRSYLQSSAG